MKSFTYSTLASIALVISSQSLFAANPKVIYSSEAVYFTDSTDAFYATTQGAGNNAYIFYGTFGDISTIKPTSTAQEIKNDFKQLGVSSDVYSTNATFEAQALDTSFAGSRGYMVAANNQDIGLATEIAIVSNSTDSDWTFKTPITALDFSYSISSADYSESNTGVDIVLGSFGAGGTGYETIKLSVIAVPEPSSFALLGLGGMALLFRRRK